MGLCRLFFRFFCRFFCRFLYLSLLCLLASACAKKEEKKNAGPPPVLVTTVAAKMQPLEIVERTLGTLEAVNEPLIAAEVAGRITEVPVRSGQPVAKGDPLARIDPIDVSAQHRANEAEIARLQALLAQQERLVQRQDELMARNFISRNAGDETRAQRDALKSQLDAARAQAALSASSLNKTRIVAPFSGVLEEKMVSPGNYVKVGDPLFKLVSNTHLRAHLPFPEALSEKIRIGQTARFSSPLLPGKTVAGKVADIRPTIVAGSRALDVIVDFDNPDGHLKSGGSIDALVVVGARERAVMVPEQAVVLRPAGEVVYTIADGRARQRVVTTGNKANGQVEIVGGLHGDETVIHDGAAFLTDGAAVTVKQEAQKPPAQQKETQKETQKEAQKETQKNTPPKSPGPPGA